MKKKILSLALALVLCLSLVIPAMAAGPRLYEDDKISITNVVDVEKKVDDYGASHIAFTCVAPVTFSALGLSDNVDSRLYVVTFANPDEVTIDNFESADLAVWTETDTVKEPGTYMIGIRVDYYNEDGMPTGYGFTKYLLIVQDGGSEDSPTAPHFSDVKPGDWFYEAVQWAAENNVANGTSASTFSPVSDCTREQIVTFLWRASGKPEPTETANPFTDVKPSDYFYKAVLWAVENNITHGSSPDTFSPQKICTRSEAMTFLWRAKGKPSSSGGNQFSDVPDGLYYTEAVAWAVENGVANGMGGGLFAPDVNCSRGQIVTFLHRAFSK